MNAAGTPACGNPAAGAHCRQVPKEGGVDGRVNLTRLIRSLQRLEVKKKYGKHYDVIMKDLHQTDDLRVLDYDGHRVFRNFTLREIRVPIYHEH
jgi:hypothetical protein